jgi:hypothetical protein
MDEIGQKYPWRQREHDFAPFKFDQVPGWHGDGVDVPNPQKDPSGQIMQFEDWLPYSLSLKYPASHIVGEEVPTVGQNDPVGQGAHCAKAEIPTVFEKKPFGHGIGMAHPTGQKWPFGHVEHNSCDVRPDADENVPGLQSESVLLQDAHADAAYGMLYIALLLPQHKEA